MKRTITKVITTLIMIGVIGFSLTVIFGENTVVYIHRELIPNSTLIWYKFDYHDYITNLETELEYYTELSLELPWTNSSDFFHVIAMILNYTILMINIMLYPLKIGGYMITIILALLGINVDTTSSLNWLGELSHNLIKFEIPYIVNW